MINDLPFSFLPLTFSHATLLTHAYHARAFLCVVCWLTGSSERWLNEALNCRRGSASEWMNKPTTKNLESSGIKNSRHSILEWNAFVILTRTHFPSVSHFIYSLGKKWEKGEASILSLSFFYLSLVLIHFSQIIIHYTIRFAFHCFVGFSWWTRCERRALGAHGARKKYKYTWWANHLKWPATFFWYSWLRKWQQHNFLSFMYDNRWWCSYQWQELCVVKTVLLLFRRLLCGLIVFCCVCTIFYVHVPGRLVVVVFLWLLRFSLSVYFLQEPFDTYFLPQAKRENMIRAFCWWFSKKICNPNFGMWRECVNFCEPVFHRNSYKVASDGRCSWRMMVLMMTRCFMQWWQQMLQCKKVEKYNKSYQNFFPSIYDDDEEGDDDEADNSQDR